MTNMVLLTLLPVLITFLITSGAWVGVYFLFGLNNGQVTNNNYYGDASTASTSLPSVNPPANPTNPPDLAQCPNTGAKYSACSAKCEFVICESLPADLYPGKDYGTTSTTDCWIRLMEAAQEEIVIGSYYWSLLVNETAGYDDVGGYAQDGARIFNGLQDAARRGIAIRIAMNEPDDDYTVAEPEAIRAINPEIVRYRTLNFPKFNNGQGILHTKAWSVDGKHSYVGSANFDWRSLTQVKEIGMATFNCDCIAEDVQRMLDIYWYMGAEDAVLPEVWPSEYSTNANHDHPYNVPRSIGPATAVHFSSAPPVLDSCGRDSDIDNMVKIIDEAEEFLYMAVMDYAPATLYNHPNTYYSVLDAAIRRAAMDRFVQVRFMMSKWAHTNKKFYSYLFDFDNFSYDLQCKNPYGQPCDAGDIDVRIYEMPTAGFETIPYGRVQHTKYFVTEKAAYIGTSNWSADYWLSTGGIGMTVRSADAGSKEKLVDDVKTLFERDWSSKYATPIYKFYINGTRIPDNA